MKCEEGREVIFCSVALLNFPSPGDTKAALLDPIIEGKDSNAHPGGGAGGTVPLLAAFTGLAKQSYWAGEDIEEGGRKKGRRQKKKEKREKKKEKRERRGN